MFLLLNSGEGLLTMSAVNWKGSGGREGRWAREGSELLRLKSGLGTRSVWEPNSNMGGPLRSGVVVSEGVWGSDGFLYW